jgi:hypothetical protein
VDRLSTDNSDDGDSDGGGGDDDDDNDDDDDDADAPRTRPTAERLAPAVYAGPGPRSITAAARVNERMFPPRPGSCSKNKRASNLKVSVLNYNNNKPNNNNNSNNDKNASARRGRGRGRDPRTGPVCPGNCSCRSCSWWWWKNQLLNEYFYNCRLEIVYTAEAAAATSA